MTTFLNRKGQKNVDVLVGEVLSALGTDETSENIPCEKEMRDTHSYGGKNVPQMFPHLRHGFRILVKENDGVSGGQVSPNIASLLKEWFIYLAELGRPAPLFKHSSNFFCINVGTSFLMAAFQTAPWSLISGTLGTMILRLMITFRILWNHYTLNPGPNTLPPGLTLELQEGSDCCSCREKWIGYLCNCYFLSDEYKSWTESRDFCASQNSSLLQLKSRDELDFANFLRYSYWIGLSYNDARGAWLWEDASTPSSNL
ncbi:natural killer cells antigen CD94-like [Tamandua tetradactyla]|uniref:natural killer cells antigen CD94-like n=1 Tax=Tamandua tetradactyla TaxID=48850 RepID=UPI004053AFE0